MQAYDTTVTPLVTRLCPQCDTSFSVRSMLIKKGRGVFCSRPCAQLSFEGRKPRPAADRFWEKVDRTTTPDGCWPWIGHTNPAGYGVFSVGTKKFLAHRFGYELQVNAIPEGAVICHICDNPPCVRGAHLVAADQAHNVQDMMAKGRSAIVTSEMRRRERNGNAKLNEWEVSEIRAIWANGDVKIAELARRYKVGWCAVKRVCVGQSWTDA